MYVCMYVCMYLYIYTYVSVCLYLHKYLHIFTCVCKYIDKYICVYTYVCIHIWIYIDSVASFFWQLQKHQNCGNSTQKKEMSRCMQLIACPFTPSLLPSPSLLTELSPSYFHGFPSVHHVVASVPLPPKRALLKLLPTVSFPFTMSSLPSRSPRGK